jgi:hypothetical protein
MIDGRHVCLAETAVLSPPITSRTLDTSILPMGVHRSIFSTVLLFDGHFVSECSSRPDTPSSVRRCQNLSICGAVLRSTNREQIVRNEGVSQAKKRRIGRPRMQETILMLSSVLPWRRNFHVRRIWLQVDRCVHWSMHAVDEFRVPPESMTMTYRLNAPYDAMHHTASNVRLSYVTSQSMTYLLNIHRPQYRASVDYFWCQLEWCQVLYLKCGYRVFTILPAASKLRSFFSWIIYVPDKHIRRAWKRSISHRTS